MVSEDVIQQGAGGFSGIAHAVIVFVEYVAQLPGVERLLSEIHIPDELAGVPQAYGPKAGIFGAPGSFLLALFFSEGVVWFEADDFGLGQVFVEIAPIVRSEAADQQALCIDRDSPFSRIVQQCPCAPAPAGRSGRR